MTDLTQDELYEQSKIYEVSVPGSLLLSESVIILADTLPGVGGVAKLQHFFDSADCRVQRFTYNL